MVRDDVSDSLAAVARCYLGLGQPHLAERLLADACRLLRAAFGGAPGDGGGGGEARVGDDHPKLLDALRALAEAKRLEGAFPDALAQLDDVLARSRRALAAPQDANHPWLLSAQCARAEVLSDAGDVRGALAAFRALTDHYGRLQKGVKDPPAFPPPMPMPLAAGGAGMMAGSLDDADAVHSDVEGSAGEEDDLALAERQVRPRCKR